MAGLTGKIPKVQGAGGMLFSRSHLLNGDIATYFGPGQDPSVVLEYSPPTDWRPANSLLVPPQVVWLSVVAYGMFDVESVSVSQAPYFVCYSGPVLPGFANNTGYSPPKEYDPANPAYSGWGAVMDQWGNVYLFIVVSNPVSYQAANPSVQIYPLGANLDRTKTPPQARFSFQVFISASTPLVASQPTIVLSNPGISVYQNALSTMQKIKSTVESLRSNRTWVQVVQWYHNLGSPGDYEDAFPGLANQPTSYYQYYLYPFILPPSDPEFFGVEFLHMWSGPPAGAANPPPVFPQSYNSALWGDYLLNLPGGQGTALGQMYDMFAKFGVALYAPSSSDVNVAITNLPGAINLPALPSSNWQYTNFVAPTQPGQPYSTSLLTAQQYQQQLAASATASQSGAGWSSGSADFYQQLASEYGNFGVTYGGDTSSLDVSDAVNTIASFFGFDPDTGLDLPASQS